MNFYQYVFILMVLYVSFVIGVALKMRNTGVKGSNLFISLYFPILSIVGIIAYIIDEFKNDKNSFFTKLTESFKVIQVSITFYPALVGSFSVHLLRQIRMEERKKHRPKKPATLAINIFRVFNQAYGECDTHAYRHA